MRRRLGLIRRVVRRFSPFLLAAIPAVHGACPASAAEAATAMAAVPASAVETDTDALPHWRQFADKKPVLLLASTVSFLRPIPEQVRAAAMDLVRSGDVGAVRAKGVFPSPDPLLLPGMALTAALEAGWFSGVVWIIPLGEGAELLPLPDFLASMAKSESFTGRDRDTFREEDGHYAGTLHGVPWRVYDAKNMPQVSGPAVLHLDGSYLFAGYRNEIRTPLLKTSLARLMELRRAAPALLGGTVSAAVIDGGVPLRERYLAALLAEALREGRSLSPPLPEKWVRWSEARNLENFFKKEMVLEQYEALARVDPRDGHARFAVYETLRQFGKGDEALAMLEEAVRLDRVYAYEYLSLARTAREKGRMASALEMLGKAATVFPDDPGIPNMEAEFLLGSPHPGAGLPAVEHLQSLPWSPTYFPGMPGRLEELRGRALSEGSPPTAPGREPSGSPGR